VGSRQEFTDRQKEAVREASAAWVRRQWPELSHPPHFFCESCGFVGPRREDFEVDHVYAAAKGGHGDRHESELRDGSQEHASPCTQLVTLPTRHLR